MKPCYLYIIMSIFSLLALPGCRDEEAVQTSEGTRTVTVNLGIAMSRADEDEDKDIGDSSTPKDMKVWIFEHDTDNRLAYIPNNAPVFSGSDALGELVNTDEHVIELENNIAALDFYVVLNSENGIGLNLGETSTRTEIKEAIFTGLETNLQDNQVPAYGCLEDFDVSEHKSSYSVPTINVTRAVSKLEMLFTKENANSTLEITEMILTNIPNQGFLTREATTDDALTYTDEASLFSGTALINTNLSDATNLGDFSEHPENFTPVSLTQPYLLENLNNTAWYDNTPDYEYPTTGVPITNAYVLNVSYTLNGRATTQAICLPETKRNIWNKIFVRVNDNGELIIQYKALPWQLVESKIGYAPQHIPTDGNPFNVKQDWEESDIAKGNYYALFPQESYNNTDRTNTSQLLHYLYDTPQGGDNEARLCILTRPTYDNAIDEEEHWALKAGSAGARYFFILTGPEGATWEAHLTNKEDFSFSTTDEDDFKGSEYEKDGNVNKVTHGIARKKPYIIQIIANHLYTGYETGMNGSSSDEDFNIDGYDKYADYSENQWEDLFEDTYLTNWGREHQNEVVETEFYITVKLTDGTEYELNINPSYNADEDIENKYFPFKEKRRYAGTDTRIWFRHIRAQYGWRNLECLARDLKEDIIEEDEEEAQPWNKAYWWTVNPYWNSEHVESVWK